MKTTLYASFNYDPKTKRLALFTGHALLPLKLAQLSVSSVDSEIYKHIILTETIEDSNADTFDVKISEFITTYMDRAAKHVRACCDDIVELHHWSDVNLGYHGATFPSLYEPSNYINKVNEIFLLNGFEHFKLKRVFVSGDLPTIDAASALFGLSNPTEELDLLSSKYVLKHSEGPLMKRFTRLTSTSPEEKKSLSSKKEGILDLSVDPITNTINSNTVSLAADPIRPPNCLSRLLACCSIFSNSFSHQNVKTQRESQIYPELVQAPTYDAEDENGLVM